MSEKSFQDLGLDPELVERLTAQGFTTPTPIQEQAIPLIIQNKDLFAQAETGSGKTGAFVFPIVHLLRNDPVIKEIGLKPQSALFIALSPTRELAQQTFQVFQNASQGLGIEIALTIGGENMDGQKEDLSKGVHVLVATPGRLIDLFKREILNLKDCVGVVLDEVDRLFDMGFKLDLHYILHKVPQTRQLIMVTATTNFEVLNMAYRFHANPVELDLGQEQLVVEHLVHSIVHLSSYEKMPYLVGLLRKTAGLIIIFCNTRVQTQVIATWLSNLNFKAMGISGDMAQNKRTDLIEAFRRKEHTILVATDLAARGLDLDDVSLVVNFDLPNEVSQYVHRIGRTARAGREGMAISLCAPHDCESLPGIEEYLKGKIPVLEVDETLLAKDVGEKPRIRLEENGDNDRVVGERDDRALISPLSKFEWKQNSGPGEKSERGTERTDRAERVGDLIGRSSGERRTKAPRTERSEQKDKGEKKEGTEKVLPQLLPKSLREITEKAEKAEKAGKAQESQQQPTPKKERVRRERTPEGTTGAPTLIKRYARPPQWKEFPRRFKVEAYSLATAQKKAQTHFKDVGEEQIEHHLLKEGRPRFWFFGPKKKLYLFFVKHNVSALIKHFLDYVTKASQLDILFDISYKNINSPVIRFFGADEGLFTRNNGEMLEALEHLLQKYLSQLCDLDKNFKLQLNCKNLNNQDKEQRLLNLAQKMKDEALKSKEAVLLPPMGSADRRVIHQFFSKDKQIKTESIGDGHYKQIKLIINS